MSELPYFARIVKDNCVDSIGLMAVVGNEPYNAIPFGGCDFNPIMWFKHLHRAFRLHLRKQVACIQSHARLGNCRL